MRVATYDSVSVVRDVVCGLTWSGGSTSATEYGAKPCASGIITGVYYYRCVRGKQISLTF